MIKEKTFYKSFMVLALSLALQNLLTYGVNMMDTLMLGRYSQNAMGGVSLCNQIQFLNIAIGKNSSHRKVLSQLGF